MGVRPFSLDTDVRRAKVLHFWANYVSKELHKLNTKDFKVN